MKNTNANKFFLPLAFLSAFLLTVLILVAQKVPSRIESEFVINEPAPRTVFSPTHFVFVDEAETQRLRQEQQSKILPVYTLDLKAKNLILSEVDEFFKNLIEARESGKIKSFSFPWSVSPAARDFFAKSDRLENVSKTLTGLLERFTADGVIEDGRKKELESLGKTKMVRFDPEKKNEEEKEMKDLQSLSEVKQRVAAFLNKEGKANEDGGKHNAILEVFINVVRPTLLYDETETKTRLKKASEGVSEITQEVKRGEMVAQRGLLVTANQQKRLIQVQKKISKKETQNRLLTVSLFVLLGFTLCFLYLKQFAPKQFQSPRFVILVLSVLLLTLTVEKVSLLIPGSSYYLLPGALAAILLTILCNPSLGILGGLATTIWTAPLADFRSEIILMIFLGSLIGCFAARGIRKRIHFLKVGLVVSIVNSAVLVAYVLLQDWPLPEAFSLFPLGFANGFIVTALSFFLVPLFEFLFNLTTDITLLELSDLNHPLLKRMVVEAPGTYHHSLVVSTLAEAACEAIGANALLARVGCYFHDIGKIARSEYFTENQQGQAASRHEKLTPTMSSLVIMNHVKDGIELAKKYKLKDVIVRFIPEHQGKGIIYYFYKKALDQAAPGEEVKADDFRYPGPKPQSRETAVALIADSVEAASRSLKEITPASIRSLVRKIINEKFIDGQLDECDLTLKNLHKIQESFVHNLLAIFHTRVSYPTAPIDPRRPDLFGIDQFEKFR